MSDYEPETDSTGESRSDSFLDQALWQRFRRIDASEEFVQSWLALLCRQIHGTAAGVLVLGEADHGPFAPAGAWPSGSAVDADLTNTAEKAMAERQGVARPGEHDGAAVAYPIMIGDALFGVVAIRVAEPHAEVRDILRQLHWGVGWLVAMLQQEELEADADRLERTDTVFDLISAVTEKPGFREAATALVTDLALRLDCDPVALGMVKRGRITVVSISHSAQYGQRMNLVRQLEAAMNEAVDQTAIVHYPVIEDWEYRVTQAHADIAEDRTVGGLLTIPLQAHDELIGALYFERPPGALFDESEIELCDAVAGVLGSILHEKQANDRSLIGKVWDTLKRQTIRLVGPDYIGRKLVVSALVLAALFFATVTGEYRVTSPAVLEGRVQRTIAAPFEGYIATQHVRAGDLVTADGLLATLDDQDLALERIRWSTKLRQGQAEYDQALALGERAKANIVLTQIDQAVAQVALLDAQLERTQIKAPFAGVVVSGDLSQSVGNAVQIGQELFKLAPLDEHRVILEVDESDIKDLQIGQEGTVLLASLPSDEFRYRVERVTSVSEQAEGRNYFRVEASLLRPDSRLRPGMEGVAKTAVDERLLFNAWTHKFFDWVTLTFWKWIP